MLGQLRRDDDGHGLWRAVTERQESCQRAAGRRNGEGAVSSGARERCANEMGGGGGGGGGEGAF